MESLKQSWADVCDRYLRAFCKKHELSYEDAYWVADDAGTVVCIGDYFISMDEIRYDIDNSIRAGVWEEYEDYDSRIRDIELRYDLLFNPERDKGRLRHLNYESFCMGAPGYTEEELEKFEAYIKSISDVKEEFLRVCVSGTVK